MTLKIHLKTKATADLVRRFFKILKPSPRLQLSEWADKYRYLSRERAAEHGKWRTSRAEYLRGIMDSVTDPTVEMTVVQKGTQIGWSEVCNNALGYFADHDPSPILMLLPTIETGEAWSKESLAPMIRDTPRLRKAFRQSKGRDGGNTLRHKEFDGGYLAIVGANAPAGVAARPIRVLLCDEVDKYPVSAGTEGDPIKLASKRQETFWNRKTLIGSSPATDLLSKIEPLYKQSDQRKFWVPCADCGSYQTLRWENVRWGKDKDGQHLSNTAYYQCDHCPAQWSDGERWEAVGKGEWRASAPFRGVAGFHISQLYSPWVKLNKIVQEFLDARGRPELLQVWTNTVVAETWREQGEGVSVEGLRSHMEPYGQFDLPEACHYATAGVDVQGDRLEVEVVGWGEGDESWGIEYRVLPGSPTDPKVWEDLDELLKTKYWTGGGRLVRIRAACIDTGGHHGAEVISFCKPRLSRRIYPIKGAAGPRPVFPKRFTFTKGETKEKIWLVGVDTAKDAIYGRLRLNKQGPGYCHLSEDYDDEWFNQITSEEAVTRFREGRPYRVWVVKPGKRNEALDNRVYAYAAQQSLTAGEKIPSTVKVDPHEMIERSAVAPDLPKSQPARVIPPTNTGRRRIMRSKGF